MEPILDVPTRWNSTYLMLQRFLIIKNEFQELLEDLNTQDPAEYSPFPESDMPMFEAFLTLLKPMYEATQETNGEKMATMYYVIPLFNVLLNRLRASKGTYEKSLTIIRGLTEERDKRASSEQQKRMASVKLLQMLDEEVYQDMINAVDMMYDKLNTYFDNSSDACDVATCLDPRFKPEWFGDDEESAERRKELIASQERNLRTMFRPYEQHGAAGDPQSAEEVPSLRSTMFRKRKRNVGGNNLDQYLRMPVVDGEEDTLEWWSKRQQTLPDLANMARDYLAIPATSTACERLFSEGRQLITDNRTRLSDESIRACQCLKNWMKS